MQSLIAHRVWNIKQNFTVLKHFCPSNTPLSKQKRPIIEQNIHNIHLTKSIIPRIKKSYNSVIRKQNNLKTEKYLRRDFIKEDVQLSNKHIRRCFTSGKCKLKAECHATTYPLEWLRLKQLTILRVGQDGEHWYLHTWSVEMQNGTIPFEVCLAFS